MSALRSVSQSLKYPAAKIKKSKHKKLDEDWFDTREPIQDGMRFSAKYIGMTLVVEPKSEDVSAAAVDRIINQSKGTKKQTMQLVVSSNGIQVFDQRTSQLVSDVSVHRISYCAALKHHLKIFAFVAQSINKEAMECHAYLCNSVKEAQSLIFTVAQSFKVAFEIREEEAQNGENGDIADANIIQINGQKKTSSMSTPYNVAERRYHRFSSESNPFDSSDSDSRQVSVTEDKRSIPEEQKETNGVGEIFVFASSLPEISHNQAIIPKSDQPITPLRPPPSRPGDKPTPRRASARPASIGNPLPTPTFQNITTSPQATPEAEELDLEKDFADLALSRTQKTNGTPKVNGTPIASQNVVYPPSNPFFSPSNPFYS